MRGIDTNVLVRILVKDDESQSRKALAYVKRHQEIFISHVVLCETVWVCKVSYDLSKADLINIVEKILGTSQFSIEDSETVWQALHEYRAFNLDFSDCVIGAIAKKASCNSVGTFDKKAAKSSLFELIS